MGNAYQLLTKVMEILREGEEESREDESINKVNMHGSISWTSSS
jgi:hypothetical protein